MKTGRTRRQGHVARMGNMRNGYYILVEGKRTGRRWEDNIGRYLREPECGLDPFGSDQGPVAGSCKYGNEPPGSTNCRELLYWLSDYQVPKNASAPWT